MPHDGRCKKHINENHRLAEATEADIKAGKLVNSGSRLKQLINRLADEGGGVRFNRESKRMIEEHETLRADPKPGRKAPNQ